MASTGYDWVFLLILGAPFLAMLLSVLALWRGRRLVAERREWLVVLGALAVAYLARVLGHLVPAQNEYAAGVAVTVGAYVIILVRIRRSNLRCAAWCLLVVLAAFLTSSL